MNACTKTASAFHKRSKQCPRLTPQQITDYKNKKASRVLTDWLLHFKKEMRLLSHYFFFFTALAFGKSVIEPSNTSAARPIDSFNVG